LRQHLSVKIFVKRNNLAGTVFFHGRGARPFPHGAQGRFIAQQIDGVTRHGLYVADVGHKSGYTVLDHFRHSAGPGGDGDDFTGHPFEGGESEGFQFAGHQHHVCDGEFFADLILLPKKRYVLVNAFLHCQPLRLGTIGPIANQQQLGRDFLAHTVEDFDHIEDAFHGPEVGKVHQQALVVGYILAALFQPFRFAQILVAVHEVRDDFDMVLDIENIERAVAQILRDGGHAVALLDGKTRNRKIRAVEPDQSDVGAVQSGDKRQMAPRWSCRQHLLGQHGAHRVRNRVVHVQQIEFVELRNLGHARGQRQIVRRIFKQRIARDLDLMIMNVRFGAGQTNGLRIGDEMNLMAAPGEFKSQFGGHNSAAAVGGITGDTNLHAPLTIPLLDSPEWLGMQEREVKLRGLPSTSRREERVCPNGDSAV